MEALLDLMLEIKSMDSACVDQLFNCRVQAKELPWYVDRTQDQTGNEYVGLYDLITSSIRTESEYKKLKVLTEK